jgi:hypothetical protein
MLLDPVIFFVPGIFPDIFPHRKEHCGRDETVLNDEGEEIWARVLDDVTHDEVPAAGEVVGEVDHALTAELIGINTCLKQFQTIFMIFR